MSTWNLDGIPGMVKPKILVLCLPSVDYSRWQETSVLRQVLGYFHLFERRVRTTRRLQPFDLPTLTSSTHWTSHSSTWHILGRVLVRPTSLSQMEWINSRKGVPKVSCCGLGRGRCLLNVLVPRPLNLFLFISLSILILPVGEYIRGWRRDVEW